ncbi:MAG: lipoyl protein ligase domain-containing protein [Puniceicoccales bacterium]
MQVLPTRTLKAAANMAVDQLLLEAYPAPDAPRFRHYGWSNPAFTFGRTQRFEEAAERLPIHASWREAHDHFASRFELVRRPTGGGVVDHRDDWTYALVLPSTHPLARAKAGDAYREIHQVLAWALQQQGIEAKLQPCPCADQSPADAEKTAVATTCFTRAEPGDVIDADGEKLAGAAQRRTRDGLLMQGTIAREPLRAIDWQRFESDFTGALAEWLGGTPVPSKFPQWPQALLTDTIAEFESKAWNERR